MQALSPWCPNIVKIIGTFRFKAGRLRQGTWLGEPRQGEEDQKGHDSNARDVEGGEQAEGTPPNSEKSRRSSSGRFNFRIRGTQCAMEQRKL